MFSPELWVLIGLHLKPRHAIKLIKTCKELQKLVDNETYWTRVYSHLVWRDCDALEIKGGTSDGILFPDNGIDFPRIEEGLYNMIGLERGYYWSMQRFFQRIDEAIEFYSKNRSDCSSEEDREWWAALKPMSMAERAKACMIKENNLQIAPDATTMKDLARVEMRKSICVNNWNPSQTAAEERNFNKFVCEIEDDPMPAKYKRMMLRKIAALFWHRWDTEGVMSPLRATDAALMMCKF